MLGIIFWGIIGLIINKIYKMFKSADKFVLWLIMGFSGLLIGKFTLELNLIFYNNLIPKIEGVPILIGFVWFIFAVCIYYISKEKVFPIPL